VGDWWGEAERWRRRGLAEPGSGACASNQANALWLHDDPWAALPLAERAVALLPQQPLAWRCLGNVLQDLGRLEEALAAYQRSLRLAADADTAFNASKVLMGLGRFAEAYALAEQRLAKPGPLAYRPGPYWQGWAPDQPQPQQLWVWSEQGFGDGLQHLRWLVPLLQRGIGITLELEPALVRLAQEGLAWVAGGRLQVRARQDQPEALPPHCCQGSLLSLPLLLGEAPLASAVPYLRLGPTGAPAPGRPPRIGLVWASGQFLDGHVLERDYRRKSLLGRPLQSLLNALAERPLELVSLQFGPDREPPPWIGRFAADLPASADFREAASWLQQLDLLISVDTAAAHLAGAMGLPVWTLLPWAAEARWQLERGTSPWYPSMRLLRQPRHGDWYGLVQLLLAHLDVWLTSWPNNCS
jgi:tetratricopeptide (TPR) repeat protein